MRFRPRPLDGLALAKLLLLVTIVELAVYRLAVPALRPAGDQPPPGWHAALNYAGLFLFYFASVLAAAALCALIVRSVWRQVEYPRAVRALIAGFGLPFAALALVNTIIVPTDTLGLAMESLFAVTVLVLVVAQVVTTGEAGARVGIALLSLPLLIHFYEPLRAQFPDGPEVLWSGLADRIRHLGQWALVFAALVSPYCFAPKPFARSAVRLAPLAAAAVAGLTAVMVLREDYAIAMELAARGLGIDIGPTAPRSIVALYVMALAGVTWTLMSCVLSHSPARRTVGFGVALVFVGGYSFSWPLQYLVGTTGLVLIGAAARQVSRQERGAGGGIETFRVPPIGGEAWQEYVGAVVRAIRQLEGGEATAVTSRAEPNGSRTHIIATLARRPVKVTVERQVGSIQSVRIAVGEFREPGPPVWTLDTRHDTGAGGAARCPDCEAAAASLGDELFDKRFTLRHPGQGGDRVAADVLFDPPRRERATSLIDGWIAGWPGVGLEFCVIPGRGAPLDRPIPITELAFRGVASPSSPEPLVALVKLLLDVDAAQARESTTEPEPSPDSSTDSPPAASSADSPPGD